MTRRSLLVPIVAGFSVILLSLAALVATGISHIDALGKQLTTLVAERSQKTELAMGMYALHRERYRSLALAAELDDPFRRDEELMRFDKLGSEYVQLRTRLDALPLTPEEKQIWTAMRNDIRVAESHATGIRHLIEEQQLESARTRLKTDFIPHQQRILSNWEGVVELQRQANAEALTKAAANRARAHSLAVLLGLAALIISAAVTGFVIQGSRRMERHLQDERERVQFTLDALEESIIRTSKHGEIIYINPAARKLLGIPPEEINGGINKAIELVDRQTRAPLLGGLLDELARGLKVVLPNNACLISKLGMEYEVEGHGAPVFGPDGALSDLVLVLRDVTEARQMLRMHPELSNRDPLTGLPVRELLDERLEKLLLSKRAADRELAYLHIRLDNLDTIQAEAGQAAAEEAFHQCAQVLQSRIRDTDILSPIGPHTFGLLLAACPGEIAERIRTNLIASIDALSFKPDGTIYKVSAQIGMIQSPPFIGDFDTCQAEAAAVLENGA